MMSVERFLSSSFSKVEAEESNCHFCHVGLSNDQIRSVILCVANGKGCD
jgi:hypothetical protein